MNTENITMAAHDAKFLVENLRAALSKSYKHGLPEARITEIILEDVLRDACELQRKLGKLADVIGGSK